jgi:hypothetical protein
MEVIIFPQLALASTIGSCAKIPLLEIKDQRSKGVVVAILSHIFICKSAQNISCKLSSNVFGALQGRDIVMHPKRGQSLVSPHSRVTVEIFQTKLKHPLGFHHTNHHVFLI